jgi:hypothetical protein
LEKKFVDLTRLRQYMTKLQEEKPQPTRKPIGIKKPPPTGARLMGATTYVSTSRCGDQ